LTFSEGGRKNKMNVKKDGNLIIEELSKIRGGISNG